MEEFLEADVLWPETPPPPSPPWGDRERFPPDLHEAAVAGFSFEPFGSEHAASSPSSTSSTSSALPFGRGSSDGFLSDVPYAFAGGHGGFDASFQEADVLWPDDGYATMDSGVDGGELWWRFCCDFDGEAAGGRPAEPAPAGGKRGSWRVPMVSSPIDIPTGVAAAAARRRVIHTGMD